MILADRPVHVLMLTERRTRGAFGKLWFNNSNICIYFEISLCCRFGRKAEDISSTLLNSNRNNPLSFRLCTISSATSITCTTFVYCDECRVFHRWLWRKKRVRTRHKIGVVMEGIWGGTGRLIWSNDRIALIESLNHWIIDCKSLNSYTCVSYLHTYHICIFIDPITTSKVSHWMDYTLL